MVGPAFFVLIETSILKGVRAGLFLDLGVLISDVMYVIVAFLFFQEVHDLMESNNKYILKIVGGAFFIAFGIMNLMKKKPVITKKKINPDDLPSGTYLMTFIKGFTINAVNPGVLFYWFTLMSILPDPHPMLGLNKTQALVIYISIILITFFSIDILKIFGAKKLKEILTPAWMRSINIVLGIILVSFGGLFLVQGIISLSMR